MDIRLLGVRGKSKKQKTISNLLGYNSDLDYPVSSKDE